MIKSAGLEFQHENGSMVTIQVRPGTVTLFAYKNSTELRYPALELTDNEFAEVLSRVVSHRQPTEEDEKG